MCEMRLGIAVTGAVVCFGKGDDDGDVGRLWEGWVAGGGEGGL